MKKVFVPVFAFMTAVLIVASAIGAPALASGDDWAYPENVHAFMFRLGIACGAVGIEMSSDPVVLMDEGNGYLFMSVGELGLGALFDPTTQQLMSLMFPMNSDYYDEQLVVLAALCEEAAVTTSSIMTKELFLQLGEIVYTQAVTALVEANRDVSIGDFSFSVKLQENGSGMLNMIIYAN